MPVNVVATYKKGVVRAPYWPHGSSGFHAQGEFTDSPRRRFPDSSRRGYTDDSRRRGYTKRDADVDETWSSAGPPPYMCCLLRQQCCLGYKDQVVSVVPFGSQGSGDFYAKEELTDDQMRSLTKRAAPESSVAVDGLETASGYKEDNIHVYSKRAAQGAVVPCAYGFYRGCVQGISQENLFSGAFTALQWSYSPASACRVCTLGPDYNQPG